MFAFEANGLGVDSDLVTAAEQTVQALRDQHVIQPWHELDCAVLIEAARGAALARGVAKAQMLTALLAARSKLPEPLSAPESDDEWTALRHERAAQWAARHTPDLEDAAVA
jgi:hypothetical protein